MKDMWGEEIPDDMLKKCRDCGEVKHITEFEVNRKFYREDLPEKHRVVRRPVCKVCRDKKKKADPAQKKLHKRPNSLDCPICGDCVDGSYARLDHSHETGKVRGWLCDNCNTALGKLKDSAVVLQRAIDWIKNA